MIKKKLKVIIVLDDEVQLAAYSYYNRKKFYNYLINEENLNTYIAEKELKIGERNIKKMSEKEFWQYISPLTERSDFKFDKVIYQAKKEKRRK